MADSQIPVYLITGFLDSGKTTLIADTLNMDYFNDGQRTVIIACEDGEIEYDPQQLIDRNAKLITVDDAAKLNDELLAELDRRFQPQRVLLELNGMWPLDTVRNLKMPKDWGLYQVIMLVNATTYDLYRSNMQSMIADMATEADMVVFNRAGAEMPLANWKRSIRALNRMAEIVFEDASGDEVEVEDILPYSLDSDHITLEDDDYGIWYLDIQEHPERYVDKTMSFKAQVLADPKFGKGIFVPGRNAMTCCADDIRFFGFLCKYAGAKGLKKGSWITLSATVKFEEAKAYEGEGVVLYAQTVTAAEKPEDPLVYFR